MAQRRMLRAGSRVVTRRGFPDRGSGDVQCSSGRGILCDRAPLQNDAHYLARGARNRGGRACLGVVPRRGPVMNFLSYGTVAWRVRQRCGTDTPTALQIAEQTLNLVASGASIAPLLWVESARRLEWLVVGLRAAAGDAERTTLVLDLAEATLTDGFAGDIVALAIGLARKTM